MFDVEHLSTHGGSLRVYLCRADAAHAISPAVTELLAHEREIGFEDIRSYERFSARVHHTKRQLLSFLIQCKEAGREAVRIWRARQREYVAELLRNRHRFP